MHPNALETVVEGQPSVQGDFTWALPWTTLRR